MSGLESLDDAADTNTEAQTLMQMMKTMMESHSSLEKQVAELMQKQHSRFRLPTANDLDESFNLKDIHLSEDIFARTPSVRRSSLLLNNPRLKRENQAQHLAMATPFESSALKKKVNYLALANLRKEKRYYDSQPGNAGAQILLWQDRYIPETGRRKLLNQFKKFNENPAKPLIDQSFRVPTEEDLFTMDFAEIFNLLEISIIPGSPADYEEEIADITRAITHNNLHYTIPAQPYYLQHLHRAIESVEQYLKIAPEKDTNGSHMPYNLGTKKNPMHGTRGTISAFMDNAMPPVLQHSMAKLMNQTTPANTLGHHFQLMRTAITSLEKMFNTYDHYLTACIDLSRARKPDDASLKHLLACQTHEQKRKVGSETKIADRHKSNRLESAEPPAETDGKSAQADNSENDDDDTTLDIHDSAAIEASELKKTPCYAYIEGKCEAGKNCTRSHDKKVLQTFLNERSAMVNKMP